MATSELGTQGSLLGQIILGYTAVRTYEQVWGNTLTLIQNPTRIWTGHLIFNQTLNLQQTLITNMTKQMIFNQTLTLTQSFPKVVTKDETQTLSLSQLAQFVKVKSNPVAQSLHFVQSAQYIRVLNLHFNQQLALTQTLGRGSIFYRTATNQLVFKTAFTRPSPFNNLTITVPQAQIVKLNKRLCIFETPTLAIVLPSPELGDTQSHQMQLLVKRSMNNVLYTYVRSNDLEKLKYTFQIGKEKSLELRNFIINSIGQIIKLTNWKGEIWLVNITSSPVDLIGKSKYVNERERVDVTLEFQGIKIAG